MPRHTLDDIVAARATAFAHSLAATAADAASEEDVRVATERQIALIAEEAGIQLQGRHEYTIARGRADSVYDRAIIEYKNPRSPRDRIGPRSDSPGTARVVAQIQRRFRDIRSTEGHPMNSLLGIGFDARRFVFVRFYDDQWRIDEPITLSRSSAERFLWGLFNLGTRGKPFTPDRLALDFGGDSAVAKASVCALYHAIAHTDHPKAATLFAEWRILFSEVCGYAIYDRSDKIEKLAASYGLHPEDIAPAQLLFAVHTYYAVFMKLLASEIMAFFHRLPSPLRRMLAAGTSAGLAREVADLEAGSIFRHLGITNFLEGDLFSWYSAVWGQPMEDLIRRMVAKLDEYNPGTLSEEPGASRDLLKKLYHQLFDKSVRHDLGEYYTPDWLADQVLDELRYTGDPDQRLLDPACGSGTFLISAINRARRWFDVNRERCKYREEDLCRKILKNIVGFDLNPLAVMAARTNYLIALHDLIGRLDTVELPIYLCDSVLTPTEYGDLFAGVGQTARVPCSATRPPQLLVPKEVAQSSESVAAYAAAIEHALAVGSTEDEFLQSCREAGVPASHAALHKDLYRQLVGVQAEDKNGVWARIIKNAFAPLFAGRFDYVAGNPPWVNWEHLPPDYRRMSEDVWKAYRLVGPTRVRKRQSSKYSKTDVSILMTYVAADKYLLPGGKLGFLITRSVFQSELGGWHFRAFRLPGGRHLRVHKVQDFDALKPFQGQAANITSLLLLSAGEQTEYPVPWQSFWPLPGSAITEDTSLAEVLARTQRKDWIAIPVTPGDKQSSWLFGEESAIRILTRLMGPSDYAPTAREGLNTRGANGVYFLDAWASCGRLFVQNRPQDGEDRELPSTPHLIEPDYIYPLLRGKDVHRWSASPSSFAIIPHSEESPTSPVAFAALPRNTQEFLASFRDKLAGRKAFRNFEPSGTDWHGLYSVLHATFAPYKVVWREMAGGAVAAVASRSRLPTGTAKVVLPDHKLFIIPCGSAAEARFVCGVFNSSLATYLIRSYALATGISTHVLDRLPIPRYRRSDPRHKRVAALSGACCRASAEQRRVTDIEQHLDSAVAEALGVSPEDLLAIQSALADLEPAAKER